MRSDVLHTCSNNLSITRTVCFLFISCARNPRWTKKIHPTNSSHGEHSKYIHSPNISWSLSREPCQCTSQCSSPSSFATPASWHPSCTHAHNKAWVHTPSQAPWLTRYMCFIRSETTLLFSLGFILLRVTGNGFGCCAFISQKSPAL